MKILFYLPAITINWFNDSLVPLIRAAAQEAEVHVVVPAYWHSTGITDQELARCLDLHMVEWVILDQDDHPSYRTVPEAPEHIIAYARALEPDYVFCRSADITTPASFPGRLHYLMESEFAPSFPASVPKGGRIMLSGPRFYDFGVLPELEEAQWQWLKREIGPCWSALAERSAQMGDRQAYLAKTGLPRDRKIIALPLQFQGPDNFFGLMHGSQGEPDRFVEEAAAAMDEDCLLAVAVHPIDQRLQTGGAIDRIGAMDRDRVRIVQYPDQRYQGEATERLVQHSDGVILSESKAISLAGYFGKPVLRRTGFATAEWVNAYTDLLGFADAIRTGKVRSADPLAFERWYAFQFANNAFAAVDTDFASLIDRADNPVNPDRWARALARHNLTC